MAEFLNVKTGNSIALGPYHVSKEELIEFASEFDPAPFHLDEEIAKKSMLGGLATSGWHNCAILMRMMCDAFILESTSLGSPGIKSCRWLKPVMAGDTLTGTTTIVSKRELNSRPGVGIIELRHELQNQKGDLVMTMENSGFFKLPL